MSIDIPPRTVVADNYALSGARPSECGSHSGPRWYVVQTHRGAERLAVAELANQDFAALLPLTLIEPKPRDPQAPRRHRKILDTPRLAPAFPGYLFVLFDVRTDPWRRICSTKGVKQLFSATPERPTPVRIGVVERLLAQLSKSMAVALPASSDDPIPEGAIVTILEGPFARQEAVCVRSGRNGMVRVQLLASGWDAEMPRNAVVVVPT